MRKAHALAVILPLLCGADAAAAAKEPEIIQSLETKVGEIVFVKLPGKPEDGYKWRLNKELSKGLDLVSVDLVGWLMAPEKQSMFFRKDSLMNVSVTGKSAGQAEIAFDYYRRQVGRTIAKTSLVRITVKPGLASR